MYEKYRDLSYGKFDSPMAVFLYDLMLDGDNGDSDASDGDGEWANQYGRRILWGDSRGFVYCNKYDSKWAAETAMGIIRHELEDGMEMLDAAQ